LIVFCFLLIFVAAVRIAGVSFSTASGKRIVETLFWAVAQQAYFLGYLFYRWNELFRKPLATALANALSFAFLHLPDPSLVALTVLAGFFFNALFLKHRNVFVLGLAHAVFAVFVLSVLHDTGVVTSTRIGPATLASFSQIIRREMKPGERVGICSKGFDSSQFGSGFNIPVESVSSEAAADHLRLFLTSKERIFCVITEGDLRRHVGNEIRTRLSELGHRYIWRLRRSPDGEFTARLLDGNGDVPKASGFRERVLLISNQPEASALDS